MATFTCPTELRETIQSLPVPYRMLTVERHVAFDVLSDWKGMDVLFSFEDELGFGECSIDELEHFCETADSICVVSGAMGDRLTPTFSLV